MICDSEKWGGGRRGGAEEEQRSRGGAEGEQRGGRRGVALLALLALVEMGDGIAQTVRRVRRFQSV